MNPKLIRLLLDYIVEDMREAIQAPGDISLNLNTVVSDIYECSENIALLIKELEETK